MAEHKGAAGMIFNSVPDPSSPGKKSKKTAKKVAKIANAKAPKQNAKAPKKQKKEKKTHHNLQIDMRYFKKPNGSVIAYDPQVHDLGSLKDRFPACKKDGSPRAKPRKKQS